jgi:preprotein translocase subunit SecA
MVMDLDRGVPARIDRKLLAGLGQDETFRMVRVPVTAAKWSTETEERLRGWDKHLRRRESDLDSREQRAELAAALSARPEQPRIKVGRNELCPCGSGLKYKHCHGLPGRWSATPR